MKKAMKQVAAIATVKMLGLATLASVEKDHVRFQADSIRTIDEAMRVAEEISEQYGILVVAAV